MDENQLVSLVTTVWLGAGALILLCWLALIVIWLLVSWGNGWKNTWKDMPPISLLLYLLFIGLLPFWSMGYLW